MHGGTRAAAAGSDNGAQSEYYLVPATPLACRDRACRATFRGVEQQMLTTPRTSFGETPDIISASMNLHRRIARRFITLATPFSRRTLPRRGRPTVQRGPLAIRARGKSKEPA